MRTPGQKFGTYYYVRNDDGTKSIGGPYVSISELARGVRKLSKRYGQQLRAAKIVGGTWYNLDPNEMEALIAELDG